MVDFGMKILLLRLRSRGGKEWSDAKVCSQTADFVNSVTVSLKVSNQVIFSLGGIFQFFEKNPFC